MRALGPLVASRRALYDGAPVVEAGGAGEEVGHVGAMLPVVPPVLLSVPLPHVVA